MVINYYNFSLFIGSVIAFASGIWIYVNNKNNPLNKIWMVLNFFIALWSMGYCVMITTTNKEVAWISNWILHAAAIFIPTFYYYFVITITGKINKKLYLYLLYFAFSLSFFFLILNPTKLFIKDVVPKYIFNFVCDAGPLYIYFTINFWFWAIFANIILLKSCLKEKGIKAQQLKYILLGNIGFIGGGSVFFLTFNINFPPYPIILFSLYPIVITYAITRYRLMSTKLILSNLYIYFILFIFVEAIYYFSVYLQEHLFGSVWTINSMLLGNVITIIFLFLFFKIFQLSKYWSDYLFYKGKNPQQNIQNIIIEINQATDLENVSNILIKKIKIFFGVKKASIIIFINEKNIRFFYKKDFSDINPSLTLPELKKINKILILDELKNDGINKKSNIKKIMDNSNIEILCPLINRGKTIGLIVLGKRNYDEAYAKEEIDLLETISYHASLAYMNAYLYDNLEEEVDKKTNELRAKNEHLKKLLAMRSEFLNIASHQLRTPISVIKGISSMFKDEDVSIEEKKELVKAIYHKSIKLQEIIDDILSATEFDSAKNFKIDLEPTDLQELLKNVVRNKEFEAQEKGLKLKLIYETEEIPLVLADEKYLRHVFINLLSNAIIFTLKGEIIINVKNVGDAIKVEIRDSGIGIPDDETKKIFQKFSRAQNAIQTYTDGSGLGLFIAKKIIDASSGSKIYLKETQLNKGTTFVVELPIYKKLIKNI